jgi:hypothetical protein
MGSIVPLQLTPRILLALAVLILGVGFGLGKYLGGSSLEGFSSMPTCSKCKKTSNSCSCKNQGLARLVCPPCREQDMSRYVLKSSIPPAPTCPDMSQYMLKTECPPAADLSKYVLKTSIPKQQPVIIDNSACRKDAGECPPCPRPRCPTANCPPQAPCPAPPPCPRAVCPQTTVKCKAEEPAGTQVRPYLSPLNMATFGN